MLYVPVKRYELLRERVLYKSLLLLSLLNRKTETEIQRDRERDRQEAGPRVE